MQSINLYFFKDLNFEISNSLIFYILSCIARKVIYCSIRKVIYCIQNDQQIFVAHIDNIISKSQNLICAKYYCSTLKSSIMSCNRNHKSMMNYDDIYKTNMDTE